MADVEYLFQSGKLTEQEQQQRKTQAKRLRFLFFVLYALGFMGLWLIVAAVAVPIFFISF